MWTRFNSLAALLTGIASVLDLKVAGAFTVCLQFASALPYTLLRNAVRCTLGVQANSGLCSCKPSRAPQVALYVSPVLSTWDIPIQSNSLSSGLCTVSKV